MVTLVRLHTGAEVPDVVIPTLMISIKEIFNSGIAGICAVSDAAAKARGEPVTISKRELDILQSYAIIDRDGGMHDSVADCLTAMCQGESFNMRLVHPVSGQPLST